MSKEIKDNKDNYQVSKKYGGKEGHPQKSQDLNDKRPCETY